MCDSKQNGTPCQNDSSSETTEDDELDYDMWEGQFQFFGPSARFNGNDDNKQLIYANGLRDHFGGNAPDDDDDDDDEGKSYQVLQQQVGVLQDSAHQRDERYTRVKAENAALQARVIMLEEQLRDTEMRCEEKIQDEQRRSKELSQRVEREKQLQLENASIRLQNSEGECEKLKEELTRQRTKIEKLELQKDELNNQVQELNFELQDAKEEVKNARERENRLINEHESQAQLLEELSKEIERLKLESRMPALPTTSLETLRLEELHEEMSQLRAENSTLLETNEELQASLLHAGLETGRILTNGENSLAHELDVMSQDDIHKALKEQQEVNRQLRTYIESILLNIVENHPQLLEVKYQAKQCFKN
ncbi:rab11 family-interacting protein 4B isoform X2 [Anthonomus grandis grandis]|uniref:rab11 family-interacting protein 4B isoform X2 n=1 Tax=Anthonomus grandis grandis TaxID=2921223 RepID=UPI0021660F90|nr:rab11 family-interacting protein 4B isoform X2 [Anthonomus grandis grandis]XP_050300679.1 rab11 family-interacting protein 4B isoform X2 [Anthonomus grandis grandis]XP_050300680.1 rab11 family-interacting protein 4B isoform X2 [Anthonomus grandis grandis]XP_050300681.1 rab11 family-interacting protein 4B isoform X2 [Anthonomus grandis grandis]